MILSDDRVCACEIVTAQTRTDLKNLTRIPVLSVMTPLSFILVSVYSRSEVIQLNERHF